MMGGMLGWLAEAAAGLGRPRGQWDFERLGTVLVYPMDRDQMQVDLRCAVMVALLMALLRFLGCCGAVGAVAHVPCCVPRWYRDGKCRGETPEKLRVLVADETSNNCWWHKRTYTTRWKETKKKKEEENFYPVVHTRTARVSRWKLLQTKKRRELGLSLYLCFFLKHTWQGYRAVCTFYFGYLLCSTARHVTEVPAKPYPNHSMPCTI